MYNLNLKDLVSPACQLFQFSGDTNLVFGTSALDICRDCWIEIEESAYEPLLELLDKVTVGIREGYDPTCPMAVPYASGSEGRSQDGVGGGKEEDED
ncbi:hypothetical protein DXG01_013610 [Tephrocybe rancida]|nr:hypothetical protein DXG01_013610 [Tephrocybe rancida]